MPRSSTPCSPVPLCKRVLKCVSVSCVFATCEASVWLKLACGAGTVAAAGLPLGRISSSSVACRHMCWVCTRQVHPGASEPKP